MSKNNIKIILALVAVLILVGAYMYVYKPNKDDADSIKSETETLETQLAELQAKEKDRDQYEAMTKEYYAKFDDVIQHFPANLDQEVSIMFMKGVEDTYHGQFDISTAGLGQATDFFTLSGNANAPDGYTCYSAALPISYTGTYDSIKDVIDYVMNFTYRMNISSFSIAYDAENDIATGTIALNAYAIAGGDREGGLVDVDIDVENGVDNIFIGGNGAPTNQSYEYDATNGEELATNNDVKITLSNAANDSVDGILVSSAGGSNVSSDENSVQTVSLDIYEEDGKNYAKYSIGSDESVVELTSSNVKVYVESSKRADADDKNGVKLNISNSTSMVVFVKVADDDTTSPRFSLGSKSGSVKVY